MEEGSQVSTVGSVDDSRWRGRVKRTWEGNGHVIDI